jgi:hypothetical protein
MAYPVGVCIQLFTERIQNAEMKVPIATMSVAEKCSRLPTFFMPNNMTPRNPASRKNAVSTSYAMSGPTIGPARSENTDQLVPNWYDITMPDTTPIANVTAKILIQYR